MNDRLFSTFSQKCILECVLALNAHFQTLIKIFILKLHNNTYHDDIDEV